MNSVQGVEASSLWRMSLGWCAVTNPKLEDVEHVVCIGCLEPKSITARAYCATLSGADVFTASKLRRCSRAGYGFPSRATCRAVNVMQQHQRVLRFAGSCSMNSFKQDWNLQILTQTAREVRLNIIVHLSFTYPILR